MSNTIHKIGVFSDIHGNITALNAVLNDLARRGVEEFICAGDMFGIGPHPVECVRRIMSLKNLTIVRGNHEDYHRTAAHLSHNFVVGDHDASHDEQLHHAWRYDTVRSDILAHEYACSLPATAAIERCGVRISVTHYAPASDIYPGFKDRAYAGFPSSDQNTAARLLDMFLTGGIDGDVIISGHQHAPALHAIDGRLLINPGSLGCSRASGGAVRHGARYGLLTVSEYGAAFEPREIEYDVDAVSHEVKLLPDGERLSGMFF